MKFVKHDNGKVRLSLIPREAKELVAKVLAFGADKYDAWNWAKGANWTRYLDATYRHLDAWAEGEDNDPETGLSHIGHALCCLCFLAVYEARGLGTDDRLKWENFETMQKVEQVDEE